MLTEWNNRDKKGYDEDVKFIQVIRLMCELNDDMFAKYKKS